ncbi:amino acid ABC transporter permease [Rhodomicrobium sp.]|uniref:amino acid ABC transporter permease n=1 Tax=Rhodomicrobium sp. TaxID=2720632 RepID=UPI0039E2E7F5
MEETGRAARFWIQAALLAAVVAFAGWLVFTAWTNIGRLPVHFGLGFLSEPAGFSVLQTLIPFDERSTYGRAFVVGLLNTLLVAGIGIALATVIGFSIGVARLAPNRLLRAVAAGYVELFRNLPLLLILFFSYFGVLRQLPPPRTGFEFAGAYLNNRGLFLPEPQGGGWFLAAALALFAAALLLKARWRVFANVGGAVALIAALAMTHIVWPEARGLSVSGGLRLIPEFVALVAALAIYTAAYIAEIVRAGIQSVARGQGQAAAALGLTGLQAMRYVVLPQALRLVVPPLTSQYLNLTKNSSLAVAIAYPDLVSIFAGTTLAQTGQAVEIMALTMGVYLTLSLATAALLNWQNARIRA